MPRKPRIVMPGVPHHVTHRGVRKQQVFFEDRDYHTYIEFLGSSCRAFGVEVLAYCLMPNHVHLVVVPEREESLRLAIGGAHERHAKRINYLRDFSGHLWQGRFGSHPMKEQHLCAAVRYVEQNPVAAGLCVSPFDFQWSSASAHLDARSDQLVNVEPMLARFPDWPAFLGVGVTKVDAARFRHHSRTGRYME